MLSAEASPHQHDTSRVNGTRLICMNSNLLGRELGSVTPQALQAAETSRLLHSLHAAPGVRFDASDGLVPATNIRNEDGGKEQQSLWAHRAGVNCIVIDRFEGR